MGDALPVGFTLSGGTGLYEVRGQLTEPGLFVGPICDPWFWWCVPGVVPGDIITDEDSTTKLGFNAAVGISIERPSGSQVYVEVQYHRIETKEPTELLPVVVGYRW